MTEPAPPYSKRRVFCDFLTDIRPAKPTFLPENYPDLSGKTALITGSNTGLGYIVAKLLYQKNCHVLMVVRTEGKGQEAKSEILKDVPKSAGRIDVIGGCDFLDLTTVNPTYQKISSALNSKPLNLIIHNAGLMSPVNTTTSKQGYEGMFAVNVLGPQLLQHYLNTLFLKKDDSLKRIVWVSSGAHLVGFKEYGINWEDPMFENISVEERPSSFTLYGQSKAANILQASAWAKVNQEIVDDIGCVSVSCYPGNLKTDLQRDWNWFSRYMSSFILYDGVYGAYTELFAALSPSLSTQNQGAYIVPFGQIRQPREDIVAGLRNGSDVKLWDLVESKISKFF